jgi:hypothetical protein
MLHLQLQVGRYEHQQLELVHLGLDPGHLTVKKLDITVTVVNATKVYGDVDPAEASSPHSPTTPPNGTRIVSSGAPERATGEDVGTYAITQGTLMAAATST